MALYQQRDSSGRTRFLLALSLSTVTALGVAAPLALKAINAPEAASIAVAPVEGEPQANADPADSDSRSLTLEGADGMGGIGSREPAKAQAHTSKSESGDIVANTVSASSQNSLLTNPTTTVPADSTSTSIGASTTTTDPNATTTTVDPSSTTSTTGASTTTSSSSSSTTSSSTSTSTTGPATTVPVVSSTTSTP